MRTLKGATAWLITDGKAGHEAQALGVAEALGVAYQVRRVAPSGLANLLAPWGPADPAFDCRPPWPALVIAVGRTAMPALRLVRRRAGACTFTVALQDPRTSPRIADLIWVPEHDRRRGANVITTLTPAHRFSARMLSELRLAADPLIDALPSPRVMVALGGVSKVWRYTRQDSERLAASLRTLAEAGASFLLTPSRRTPPEVLAAAREAIAPFPHILFSGEGENPYARFLAKADAIVVTADSVSMTGEAVATGRPVLVFRPSGGSAKFIRFHDALTALGATRALDAGTACDLDWSHAPVVAADDIARAIEDRWRSRARLLSAMMER